MNCVRFPLEWRAMALSQAGNVMRAAKRARDSHFVLLSDEKKCERFRLVAIFLRHVIRGNHFGFIFYSTTFDLFLFFSLSHS